ncbi:unnamed protein product [Rotaria sp. Silwood2]|nr:unnamed protein product [Rotaria sp. Silwood2]
MYYGIQNMIIWNDTAARILDWIVTRYNLNDNYQLFVTTFNIIFDTGLLHTYTKDPLPPSAPRKTRPSTKNKIDKCLTSISPHVQKLIYTEAIDKRKGAILSGKLPLNPEQYTLMQKLGAT